MPQFDKITFFNQIFWLFIFFSGSYLILLKVFLPRLGETLKIRVKKLQKGSTGVDRYITEEESVLNESKLALLSTSDVLKLMVNSSIENGDSWLGKEAALLKRRSLKRSNSSFELSLYKKNLENYVLSRF